VTDKQFFWYILVNSVVAVGTVGTVIAALFGERLRAKFFPPVFKVKILKPAGEPCPITDQAGKKVADGRYYHLDVRNKRLSVEATHSQLRLTRIEIPGPDGQFQIIWDGDIPIRRRHQEFYPTESVIGSPIHYDLCAIVNGQTPTLSLMPIVAANNLPIHWIGDAHFIASFQLKCSQRDSEVVRIQFDWDGVWQQGDAEMQKHLKLKEAAE
jgi:hypothetical protein